MVCKKNEFKYLLSLATTESYFIFNNKLYNQIDGVAMGFQLRPSLANEFLGHHEQNWLDSCPLEYRVHIIDGMFTIYFWTFKSSDHFNVI